MGLTIRETDLCGVEQETTDVGLLHFLQIRQVSSPVPDIVEKFDVLFSS